jgi:gluconolactonase
LHSELVRLGTLDLVVDRTLFDQPNGLCFSPDEQQLYINDTVRALIRVFDVRPDGSLGLHRIFAAGVRSELEPGVPMAPRLGAIRHAERGGGHQDQ